MTYVDVIVEKSSGKMFFELNLCCMSATAFCFRSFRPYCNPVLQRGIRVTSGIFLLCPRCGISTSESIMEVDRRGPQRQQIDLRSQPSEISEEQTRCRQYKGRIEELSTWEWMGEQFII